MKLPYEKWDWVKDSAFLVGIVLSHFATNEEGSEFAKGLMFAFIAFLWWLSREKRKEEWWEEQEREIARTQEAHRKLHEAKEKRQAASGEVENVGEGLTYEEAFRRVFGQAPW